VKFRLRAFALHLAGSTTVLALVWGVLYLGWYYWPGWYLTGVSLVAGLMVGVDLVLGPSLTLLIANPNKPRRELTRDIGVIVAVQVCALIYGTTTLWSGRPLYYLYSEKWLELVQASDISAHEANLARDQNPQFAPHWYSLPRWAWAPLPDNREEAKRIIQQALAGGADVTQMPRMFRSYERGYSEMRARLKVLESLREFTAQDKKNLRRQMIERGFDADQPIGMVLIGHAGPLLAVVDPATLHIRALLRPDR